MRVCPLCGGPAAGEAFPYATRWNGKSFSYLACRDCSTTFVDPVPAPEDFAAMYAKENYHDIHYRTPDACPGAASLARVRPLLGARRSLLDYGCGMGGFLIAAKQAGLDPCGVEYDAEVRRSAAANSDCRVVAWEDLRSSTSKFDIIHLGDVLEHLPDPGRLISELRGLLASGGVFFVEGPLQRNPSLVYWCAASFKALRRRTGTDATGTTPPTHLLLTEHRSQKRFFTERLGLDCLLYEVDESGWPYLSEDGRHSREAGPAFKHLVALAAIQASKIKAPGFPVLGNRFLGIFARREG